MTPELQILTVNAVCLTIAYFGIYPSMRNLTLGRLAVADAVVTVLAIGTSGALFAGSGQRFNLVLTQSGWFAFALLTFALMALPMMILFLRRHGDRIRGDRS